MSVLGVDAGDWGLSWAVDEDGRLRQIGLGSGAHPLEVSAALNLYPSAHPCLGDGDPLRPPALRITHADGTLSTRLVVREIRDRAVEGGRHHVVELADELFELSVELHLRTHMASSVIEQWMEIEHGEPAAVRLHDYDSVAWMLLAAPDATAVQFGGGGWADEWAWCEEPLSAGTKSFDSLGGVQPHLQRSPCLLLCPEGPASETEGTVLGLSVAWGGNTRIALDVRRRPCAWDLRVRAGANPVGAEYVLDPGRLFVTPTVAWTWSGDGHQEVTRRFHRWTRQRVLRDPQRIRPVVANNWEATYFDFDEERLARIMDGAADVGAEVFLLDDGWFGTAHPRDDDSAGLGDWEVNTAKLPGGIDALVTEAERRGLRLGIWVEPEMVNPASRLYAEHPDWVVRDARPPREHRQQLVLDPLRTEVRDFEVQVIDEVLSHRGVTSLKWDANRPVTDPRSGALAPDRQSNLWVDQVWATWSVMERVAEAHPSVEMMLCASGGGRTDHGTLRHFHEFWTSDNTDPVARVRMQWACSYFFPAAAMAAHVTRWGERPVAFAAAVALSGRFGFDLDFTRLSAEEMSVCRRAASLARELGALIQQGELVRIVSPMGGSTRAALALIAADRAAAVLFAYQVEEPTDAPPPLVLRGLDPDAAYQLGTTDLAADPEAVGTFTGAELAAGVLRWPLTEPCTARIWILSAS